MPKDPQKIAIIGFGAMARSLQASLARTEVGVAIRATLLPLEFHASTEVPEGIHLFGTVEELIEWGPSLVVECASHEAVRNAVPALLRAGIDVVVVSVGSLSDATLLAKLEKAAQLGNSRLTIATGAIGGLDVLRSAKSAGLDAVVYRGSKPPAAWKGTPADDEFHLAGLRESTVIFEGTALEASALYPKNANVTAAVALAGIGFEKTKVTLVADPDSEINTHQVEAHGAFGRFSILLENRPLPDNPKTSWLAALSIEQCITRHFRNIEL
ncbi:MULTISPECIES: aspartate dehydrogenase [unclassified Rhizobium]|uniref:aspartate dehydrogenase n=1 Tax=unclassified Rhizobium TaxID=2613769 RepID=UPI000BE9AD69|nr:MULTISPECIES: aspartate dehydrogenase [unclassified Rhizobium]MDF0661652.1 aspartate dehydrogenase [Rhizobium sp. BC49]PDS87540.1 aspartate dehydrogenase [Rhizobium sp. L18]